jgi:hypothetical protein
LAIWELLENEPNPSGLVSSSRCRINEIKANAELDFVPGCGDVMAVILLPYVYVVDGVTVADGGIPIYEDLPENAEKYYVQPVFIPIPVPCCDETAWAGVEGLDVPPPDDGDNYTIEFPGKNWAMYFEYEVPEP